MDLGVNGLLEDWGRWVRAHDLGSYASPIYYMMREKQGTVVSIPPVDDDTALRVDRAVARLRCRDAEMGRVIFLYYVAGMSIRVVAKEMGLPKHKASTLLNSGSVWIDGNLDKYDRVA